MKKASLNEMMGKSAEKAENRKLSLADLKDLLGERMPKFDHTPVGRLRLITALRNRFGDDYKNLPGITDILEDFDKEAEFNITLHKMKLIKGKKHG
jgi:hypothetical protein